MRHGARAVTAVFFMAMALGACAKDPNEAGMSGTGNRPAMTGGTGGSTGGSANPGPGETFGNPTVVGANMSDDRWQKAAVIRNGVNYFFMANGWGPGFMSQLVKWNGTAFTVVSMQGRQGPNWEPASYPTMFCGVYSDSRSEQCGLPKAISEIGSLKTGWIWRPNGNNGQYNAAYDIWLANDSTSASARSAFLMVWLRDPVGQQPAGSPVHRNITVPNTPGSWTIWSGVIEGDPCISYVLGDNNDVHKLEFDVMDFIEDARGRNVNLPGNQVLSVAVGFEIWNGPISNLISDDFYVAVE